jgi:two-component system sensor histidine kinase DesK
VTVRSRGTPLPDPLDDLFGWALREGTTNIVRHAHATRCQIDVAFGADGAILEITDNGVAGPYQPGNGLHGLAERIDAAGGTMEAGPDPSGFRLRVAVPFEERWGES